MSAVVGKLNIQIHPTVKLENKKSTYSKKIKLSGADKLMQSAIFLGTYPGLDKDMLDFEIDIILLILFLHIIEHIPRLIFCDFVDAP